MTPLLITATTSHLARGGVGVALLSAVLFASCGNGTDSSERAENAVTTSLGSGSTTDLTAPTAASNTDADTTDTTTTTVTTTTTTSQPIDDRSFISEVLASRASPDGWSLPAGVHVVDTFEPPVEIVTSTDLVVVRASPNAVQFALPGSEGRSTVTMLVPSAVITPTGPVAMPDDLVEFASALVGVEVLDVVETGSGDERPIRDVTLTVDRPTNAPSFPCVYGDDCVSVFATEANELVHAAAGRPFHVFVTDHDAQPLVLLTQATDGAMELVADVAAGLARAQTVDDEFVLADGPAFLATAGVRENNLRAGSYRTHLRNAVLGFEIDSDIEAVRLQLVEPRAVVVVVDQLGSIAFLDTDGLLDPAAPGGSPFERILDDAPATVAEFDTWLRQFVSVEATGDDEIGGLPATWWDVEVDPDIGSEPCGPRSTSGDGRCIDVIATDVVRYVSDQNSNRVYFVPEAQTVVHATAISPDGMQSLLQTSLPLFEAATLEPVQRGAGLLARKRP